MDLGLLGERPALGWPIRQHSFLHGRTFSLYSTWCPSERHLAGFVIHKDSSFYIERCSRICITFINGYIWKNVHMLFISDADGWNTQWGFCSFLGGWGWRWLMTCHVSGVVVGDGGGCGGTMVVTSSVFSKPSPSLLWPSITAAERGETGAHINTVRTLMDC